MHSISRTDSQLPSPLSDDLVERIASRLRAMGEPMRIRILDALRDGPHTVGEIAAAIGAGQQNTSKHLAILHATGLLARRKRGTYVEYDIVDPTVFAICEAVCGTLTTTNDPEAAR